MRETGVRERGKGYYSEPGGETNDCLWIERRQMLPLGKWLIKVKGNPHVRSWCLILIGSVNKVKQMLLFFFFF